MFLFFSFFLGGGYSFCVFSVVYTCRDTARQPYIYSLINLELNWIELNWIGLTDWCWTELKLGWDWIEQFVRSDGCPYIQLCKNLYIRETSLLDDEGGGPAPKKWKKKMEKNKRTRTGTEKVYMAYPTYLPTSLPPLPAILQTLLLVYTYWCSCHDKHGPQVRCCR